MLTIVNFCRSCTYFNLLLNYTSLWKEIINYYRPHFDPTGKSLSYLIKICQAISSPGKIYTSGNNLFYQCGRQNRDRYPEFCRPDNFDDNVIQIAAGTFHTALVTVDGRLFTTGSNRYGQLGFTSICDSVSLTQVPGVNNAVKVACGSHFTLFLTSEGQVYGCGHNKYGSLGDDYQDPTTTFRLISELSGIIDIACGDFHTALINECGNSIFWKIMIRILSPK